MLYIDLHRRIAQFQGQSLALNDRAFDLLVLLARQPGDLVPQGLLERALWRGRHIDASNLRAQVATLRRQLGDGAVRTVIGRGYALTVPVAVVPAAAGPVAAEPAAAGRPRLGGSPPGRLGDLIGRAACLAQLAGLLQQHRLVSVLGPGGIGKTRVALELAHRQLPALPGGLAWADLAPCPADGTDAQALCQALADAAALQWDAPADTPPARHLGQVLHQACGGAAALLVLDNAEHLKAPLAALLPDLLAAAPALHVLVTSQHALPLAAGQAHWLAALALPADGADADAIAASPAVQLLLRRAQALHPQWQPAAADWPAIGALARALDGLALALELAAARLPLLGAPALLAGLADRLLTLGTQLPARHPASGALARQRSLQAAMDWSFRLLSPTAQAALCRLAAFAAPFRLDTAVQLLADQLDPGRAEQAVQGLVEHAMLQLLPAGAHGAPARLRLADTTRLHALQALGHTAHQQARRRHAQAMAGLARQASDDFFDASDVAWQARWGPDHADLQRAFDQAQAQGDANSAADIIEALVLGANITGALQPALQRWQATRDLAATAAPPARAKLLGWGTLARAAGTSRLAQSTQRVQAWRQVPADMGRRGLCVALAMHAAVCQDSGDSAAADAALAECLVLEAPDWPARQRRRGSWYALTRLAIARDDDTLLARAGRLSARLGVELQQLGAWREHTLVQGQQALMLRLRGHPAEAAALLADAAHTQLQLGCGLDAGRSLGLQAAALAEQMDAADATGSAAATGLLHQACATACRALELLAPYPALIIEFADALAGLAARCGAPELAAQLLAGAAQQRQAQEKPGNRLVLQAAQRAGQRARAQLAADHWALCSAQGQALSAEALRTVARRGLDLAGPPLPQPPG